MRRKTKSQRKLDKAFHELKANPPARLANSKKKGGALQAQRVAIAHSKARAQGARLPRKKSISRRRG